MDFCCEAYRRRTSRLRHLGFPTGGLLYTAPGLLTIEDDDLAWRPHEPTEADPLTIPLASVEGVTRRGDPFHGRILVTVLLDDASHELWFDAGAAEDFTRHLESSGWTWVKQPTRPGEPALRPPGWVHPYRRQPPPSRG